MMREALTQRDGRSLIEEDAHSDRSQSTSSGVLEHCSCPLDRDARKPLDELRDGCTVLEILEEGGYRYARAAKHPGAAHPGWRAFNGRTGRPVNHDHIVTSVGDRSYLRLSAH